MMHILKLTDKELKALKVISNYAKVNDAYVFVADELITDDTKAQELIRQLDNKIQKLN